MVTLPAAAREKNKGEYGAGLIVNVPFPESEVTQVVRDVVQNGIIRGTKEYNKDQYITGAESAPSTRVFPEWTEGGKIFYKVRYKAIDPRNFKDGGDVGTLAVRYVVQPQDNTHTVLVINAVYVEDFRHISHASNGSVEGAEYKDIHDRLDQIELLKAEASETARERPTPVANVQTPAAASPQVATQPASAAPVPDQTALPAAAMPSATAESLDQQIHDLRRQVQRTVKAPGAPLKSAPFHTATNLLLLPTGAEILIVISTPYWVGVETHEGQHGWMLRDDLEQIP
ncbi:MAG: hypothetical protein WAM79_14705 [Candidatus Sulfotelmatobacter sp.]